MGVGCRQLRDPVLQDPDGWPQGRPVNSIMAQLCEPQDVWDLAGITGESTRLSSPLSLRAGSAGPQNRSSGGRARRLSPVPRPHRVASLSDFLLSLE